jgi:Domain of unknown function (DUF4440)
MLAAQARPGRIRPIPPTPLGHPRETRLAKEDIVDDNAALLELNEQFIDAFRNGSWEQLEPVLSPGFSYLDGITGEVWEHERYVENLRANPSPTLQIDQVVVHVDGDTAVVSARTSRPGRHGRYVDTYERRDGGWLCVHACVWPLPD